MTLIGTSVIEGSASGTLRLLQAPLSLWGGYDPHSGQVIDATHPDVGATLAGCILAMPTARGSSSSSSTLVEAARLKTAPRAIVMIGNDPILVIGALVAAELYATEIPIALLDHRDWPALADGRTVTLTAGPHGATLNFEV